MTARPVPPVPDDLFARHQTITGLRALADFLEANPTVPVDEYGDPLTFFTRPVSISDDHSAALVDQVAAVLGVQVDDRRAVGGHYRASRSFGRISYEIVHIPERAMELLDAQMSYSRNITLDHPDESDASAASGRVA